MNLELNKVYEGDCLELMKQMPDNYIDLIITDPPYGIGITNKVGGDNLGKAKDYVAFEDSCTPSKEVFEEMKRVSKNQIIFGGNYFIEYLSNSPCWVVWDKDNTGNFADCELAWTSFPTAVRKFKFRWNGMLQEQMNWKEKREHPTQKPVALGRWLLKNYAKEGDLIYDPFSGSGSFLVACKQGGFKYLGSELMPEYVKVINKRLAFDTLDKFAKANTEGDK